MKAKGNNFKSLFSKAAKAVYELMTIILYYFDIYITKVFSASFEIRDEIFV